MSHRNSQFQRFSGCFSCRACGRKTRNTGDNGSVELCPFCYEEANLENQLSDGYITQAEFDRDLEQLKIRFNRVPAAKAPKAVKVEAKPAQVAFLEYCGIEG